MDQYVPSTHTLPLNLRVPSINISPPAVPSRRMSIESDAHLNDTSDADVPRGTFTLISNSN
jgi:hypothetical protein